MNALDDTIVAIITPRGVGGVGVVRLSGENSQQILFKLLEKPPNCLEPRRVYYGWISLNGRRIDEALYYFMRRPNSYTGEDIVEISSHGNPFIINKIVERAVELGARRAEAGEFTRRAFLNGRIDLAQAEAIADLISSQAARGHENAVSQLMGKLSSEIRDLREKLVNLLAEIELDIDYEADNVSGGIEASESAKILAEVSGQIDRLLSGFGKGMVARRGIRVAIIGLSNVGKSSLFNALLGQERAIVTSQPGTTRDTIEESLEIEGVSCLLIDSAGIRQAADLAETAGVDRARRELKASELTLIVTEANRGLNSEEEALIRQALASGRALLVLNKIDLGLNGHNSQISGLPICKVSAVANNGIDDLKKLMIKVMGVAGVGEGITTPAINERHQECLLSARVAIGRGLEAIESGKGSEYLAADLKEAIMSLGEISGEAVSEEVINTIFEKFCVGK